MFVMIYGVNITSQMSFTSLSICTCLHCFGLIMTYLIMTWLFIYVFLNFIFIDCVNLNIMLFMQDFYSLQ